jgi:predicted RNase H-like nuclease (RuvC/YqgF family)
MIWLLENWVAIVSTLSIPVAWVFGGKQAKKVEIKNSNGDFLTKVQNIYDALVEDLKTDRDELRACNVEQTKDIADLRNDVRSLQKQFNDLYLAYAKEVEASKYWKDKFDALELKYIVLEKDHETLKKQFEIYKKSNK